MNQPSPGALQPTHRHALDCLQGLAVKHHTTGVLSEVALQRGGRGGGGGGGAGARGACCEPRCQEGSSQLHTMQAAPRPPCRTCAATGGGRFKSITHLVGVKRQLVAFVGLILEVGSPGNDGALGAGGGRGSSLRVGKRGESRCRREV